MLGNSVCYCGIRSLILAWSGYDAKTKVSFHSLILPPLFTYAVDHERKGKGI